MDDERKDLQRKGGEGESLSKGSGKPVRKTHELVRRREDLM